MAGTPVEFAITDLAEMAEPDLQQAFTDAGFNMAPILADGFKLTEVGLGGQNTGVSGFPHVVIEWTENRVIFSQP